MTDRILGTQCSTKGTDDVCSYCGSVLPDYCNKADADARDAKLAADAKETPDAPTVHVAPPAVHTKHGGK